MIYTVTLNPSLDYVMELAGKGNLINNSVNRCARETFYPGGKGINVSIVLNNLGVASKALGFTAGFVGRELEDKLEALGCQPEFFHLQGGHGYTRINVKIKDGSVGNSPETEINGCGPFISSQDIELLEERVSRLSQGDYLVLAGSIPGGVDKDVYRRLIDMLKVGVRVVADCTGEALESVMSKRPFLVKPNVFELEDFFHTKISGESEIGVYAKKLQALGAANVIVSMGHEGALLLDEQENIYRLSPPNTPPIINTVGAGDSMLAGVLAGLCYGIPFDKLLHWGVAAGTATAISPWLTDRDTFETVLGTIN